MDLDQGLIKSWGRRKQPPPQMKESGHSFPECEQQRDLMDSSPPVGSLLSAPPDPASITPASSPAEREGRNLRLRL